MKHCDACGEAFTGDGCAQKPRAEFREYLNKVCATTPSVGNADAVREQIEDILLEEVEWNRHKRLVTWGDAVARLAALFSAAPADAASEAKS